MARLSYDSIAAKEVKIMKEGIHPKYQKATVTCVCGNTFVTGSTKPELRVEICSKCHPFFTGKQKLVDAGGRVDRFKNIVDEMTDEAYNASIRNPCKRRRRNA